MEEITLRRSFVSRKMNRLFRAILKIQIDINWLFIAFLKIQINFEIQGDFDAPSPPSSAPKRARAKQVVQDQRCLKVVVLIVLGLSICRIGRLKDTKTLSDLDSLCNCKEDVRKKVHSVIEKFAERGLRSLAVARQEVPEKTKDSPGAPWQFVGLLPLFDPPRHDGADTIKRALNLGVNVKMITGDQLAIGKETGGRLGMGTNMYPSSALLGQDKDASVVALPVDELIEKADGFAVVFPEHKYEIVKRLQERKHICGMTGDGVNDAPALKKVDIGIAVADATHAARGASDIVLTEPGLSVIISVVLTSRAIFQRMKNYTFQLPSILWNNHDILKGSDKFGVRPLGEKRPEQMMAALYLQVSIVSQALIFVTRSHSWSFAERPRLLLLFAFVAAQLIATLIVVYAKWGFAKIEGCGWGWAGVIWLYSVWESLGYPFGEQTAFTTKSNYGKEEREAQWATAQRTLHGLQLPKTTNLFSDKSNYRELSEIAEQAKRRVEVASVFKLRDGDLGISGDGYRWRKYGQKMVKGNPHPSYTYSGEASEEFDRDDNTLTLIKPSPMPSKDIRSPLEVRSVHGGNNGVWNVDLEENKIE
ncbi:unnamed protein product [Camellia sinensis]